jgi:hypothetical protein
VLLCVASGENLQPHLGHILSAVSSCIDSNEKQVVAAGLKVVEPSLHYLTQEHVSDSCWGPLADTCRGDCSLVG